MRKNHTFGVPVLLFVGVMFAPTGSAAEKYLFEADEVFDPWNYMGEGFVGEFKSGGTLKCPGHEPIVLPMQPASCPEGSRTHLRNGVIVSRVDSDDERVAGDMTVMLNANWNANYEGPIWGTFIIELDSDSGGTWAGTWEGLRVFENPFWRATLRVNGKGFGGIVDGMKLSAEDQIEGIFPMPVAYEGSIEGRIIDSN